MQCNLLHIFFNLSVPVFLSVSPATLDDLPVGLCSGPKRQKERVSFYLFIRQLPWWVKMLLHNVCISQFAMVGH